MPSAGERIGPYELLRRLGGGAFGEVWLVRHLDLRVERAMKIPTDPDYVKQLRLEGQIQFDLKHPNIVETLELDSWHTPPYFVMEYVEGQDLRKVLNARGKLPVPEALGILTQILDALSAAHARGILHRDLKPENILLTPDGRVKVADFGLGRVQSQVAQSLILSGSLVSSEGKSVSGTFEYMSPEQRRGEPADPQDDLYAVGILGCELLTGSRPTGAGVAAMFRHAGFDKALSDPFEKALEDAQYRFGYAAEMRAAVQGAKAEQEGRNEAGRRRAADEARHREEEDRRVEEEALRCEDEAVRRAVVCPHCGENVAVREKNIGKVVRCPVCGQMFKPGGHAGAVPGRNTTSPSEVLQAGCSSSPPSPKDSVAQKASGHQLPWKGILKDLEKKHNSLIAIHLSISLVIPIGARVAGVEGGYCIGLFFLLLLGGLTFLGLSLPYIRRAARLFDLAYPDGSVERAKAIEALGQHPKLAAQTLSSMVEARERKRRAAKGK